MWLIYVYLCLYVPVLLSLIQYKVSKFLALTQLLIIFWNFDANFEQGHSFDGFVAKMQRSSDSLLPLFHLMLCGSWPLSSKATIISNWDTLVQLRFCIFIYQSFKLQSSTWEKCAALVTSTSSKTTNWVIGSLLFPAADEPHFAHNMQGVFPYFPKMK